MLKFIHGTDKGTAVLSAVLIVVILSTFFIGLVANIAASKRYTSEYKNNVMHKIEQSNKEIINRYDFD